MKASSLKELEIFHQAWGGSFTREVASRLGELDKLGKFNEEVDEEQVALYLFTLAASEGAPKVPGTVQHQLSLVNKEGRLFVSKLSSILVHTDRIKDEIKNVLIHCHKSIVQYQDGSEEIFSTGLGKETDVLTALPSEFLYQLSEALNPKSSHS